MIGGAMGVGKSAVCRELKGMLDRSVLLCGDDCWDMHPFTVNDETKAMVTENICFLLGSFLQCSAIENVIFDWVMQEQSIIDGILSRIDTSGCEVIAVSLVCGAGTLKGRLTADVNAHKRQPDVIERSLKYLPLYDRLDTVKLNVSNITPREAAQAIAEMGGMRA